MTEKKNKPIAMILAGYNKMSKRARKKMLKEIKEEYDGEEIYMGTNKFLYKLAGKPVIQYVLDAVYNAKKNGKRLYDQIYIYNDVKSFKEQIDLSAYTNVHIKQMKDSVGGHWKDFYVNYLDYGQRVDFFFGDTPRIQPGDVEYIHEDYGKVLLTTEPYRNLPVYILFGIVTFDDLGDNWLPHRIKYVKRGANRGKLKSFACFEDFQARVGNSGAMIKDKETDELVESEACNLFYNVRKILTPTSFSKVMYYLWKNKHLKMIGQIKRRSINLQDYYNALFDVTSKLFKIDLSRMGGLFHIIKKNAARWENDIDGPKDFELIQKKFAEGKR